MSSSGGDGGAVQDLDDLAVRHGTDKAKRKYGGHSYTIVYSMLFHAMRNSVQNVTELGTYKGSSLKMWNDYFPKARIWGVDAYNLVSDVLPPRITTLTLSCLDPPAVAALNLAPLSMDIIIDDATHMSATNQGALELWWPMLKVGGYYVIEDIDVGINPVGDDAKVNSETFKKMQPGFSALAHGGPRLWTNFTRRIMHQNDVFFADTLVGQRHLEDIEATPSVAHAMQYRNRVDHNSHLLVILKRDPSLKRRHHI